MHRDTAEGRADGHDVLDPMQIAHHPLFTAREKIELLRQMKAEVTHEDASERLAGFSPEELDEAIEEVKLGARDGVGTLTLPGGDA